MICWQGNAGYLPFVSAEFDPSYSMSQCSTRFIMQDRYDNFVLIDHFLDVWTDEELLFAHSS